MNYTKPQKLFNSGFILIFLANLFMHMSQQLLNTLVPKYANYLGATPTIVGLVSGFFTLSALLIKPISSPTYDIFKKRYIYFVSFVFLIMSYVIYYFAPNVSWVLAGRFLQGFGVGLAAPMSLSIVCDNIPEDQFARGVSIFSLGQAFGQAIGPGIGLSLSKSIGYRSTFLVCICVIVVGAVISLFTRAQDPAPGAKYRIRLDKIVTKEAIPAAVIMMFSIMPYGCIAGFLAIYADLLGIANIGTYFTVYAIAILALRFVTGGLADRFGYKKLLLFSLTSFALTFVLFSVSRGIVGFIAAAILAALGYGLILPNVQAMGMKSVPAEKRSVGSNTLYLGQDVGQFVGAYIAGAFVDLLIRQKTAAGAAQESAQISAYSTMYLCLIIWLVIAAVLVIINDRRIRKSEG